ncbi:MAG: hypothetical protein QW745_07095 [Thermoplasmata archaeon]|nr:hypothetical protein [Candidatus Rehaiarchaeum fermentans]
MAKKDRIELVGIINRRGTESGYRYATIESMKEFKRFTFPMLIFLAIFFKFGIGVP